MTGDERNTDACESAASLLSGALAIVAGDVRALSDAELQRRLVEVARLNRLADAAAARLAGEIASRSGHSSGHSGLAARQGYRNAESLVRELCRSSYREAAALVRVGSAIADAADGGNAGKGFSSVLDGVLGGDIALDAADGVLRALGPVAGEAEPSELGLVVGALARESRTSHADAVTRMAGAARDMLDRAGIAEREQRLRARRFLRIGPEIDGMRRLTGLLDPESAAIIVSAVDAVTAPRRGGPRFADPSDGPSTDGLRAGAAETDIRSVEQLALDSVVEMVRIAGEADTGRVFGMSRPAVRVSVAYADLRSELEAADQVGAGSGIAFLETSTVPVSAATARRIACNAGVLPIVFGGESEILDVGRTRRLFTGAQRVALAARDGGCRWPGCDRPPSWTEAHHIDPWAAGGRTDLADGVLLCRHHHLLLHNNGWRVVKEAAPGEFTLIRPSSMDSESQPIPMPPRHPRASRAREPNSAPQGRATSSPGGASSSLRGRASTPPGRAGTVRPTFSSRVG
ncbi:MAG TPA: DUF222 domain-containing protein [Diaminobutyricibacter sp.]